MHCLARAALVESTINRYKYHVNALSLASQVSSFAKALQAHDTVRSFFFLSQQRHYLACAPQGQRNYKQSLRLQPHVQLLCIRCICKQGTRWKLAKALHVYRSSDHCTLPSYPRAALVSGGLRLQVRIRTVTVPHLSIGQHPEPPGSPPPQSLSSTPLPLQVCLPWCEYAYDSGALTDLSGPCRFGGRASAETVAQKPF